MKKAQLMQVGKGLFALRENFNPGGAHNYGVPRGFVTDLYSIPKPFWWRYAPHEYAVEPSIVHDFYLGLDSLEKRQIDKAFYDLMLDYNVPKKVARRFYTAVSKFGGREISRAQYRVRGLLNTVEMDEIENNYFGLKAQEILKRKQII